MKTETEVKQLLKITEKTLKVTRKRFEKYDNYEDMDLCDALEAQIEILKVVLS